MPNRFLFGVVFDRPGSRGEALWFQNKQSLSLERGWEGDCPPQADANPMDPYEQKAVSFRRQPEFKQRCSIRFVPIMEIQI